MTIHFPLRYDAEQFNSLFMQSLNPEVENATYNEAKDRALRTTLHRCVELRTTSREDSSTLFGLVLSLRFTIANANFAALSPSPAAS